MIFNFMLHGATVLGSGLFASAYTAHLVAKSRFWSRRLTNRSVWPLLANLPVGGAAVGLLAWATGWDILISAAAGLAAGAILYRPWGTR